MYRPLRPSVATWECPTWLRRRWRASLRSRDHTIFDLVCDFFSRTMSGELIWR